MIKYNQETLIRSAINWAEESAPESFDPSFLYSVKDAYEHYGQLTDRQEAALIRILDKFNVDIDGHDY